MNEAQIIKQDQISNISQLTNEAQILKEHQISKQ
jgi:hypothetical protein